MLKNNISTSHHVYNIYFSVLIENIADNVDRTRDRMSQQTSHITVVGRKDRTFGI